MPTVKEKIAYLKGLMEGSDFMGRDQHARSVWSGVLEILEELADEVEALRIGQEETEEYLEAIDSDLGDIEEEVYGSADDDDDDVEFVEMECPECKQTVYFEEDFLYDDDVEITCPECGAVIFVSESEDDRDEQAEKQAAVNGRVDAGAAERVTTEQQPR